MHQVDHALNHIRRYILGLVMFLGDFDLQQKRQVLQVLIKEAIHLFCTWALSLLIHPCVKESNFDILGLQDHQVEAREEQRS